MSTRLGDDDAGRDAFEPGLIGATSRQTGVKACGSGGSVILANSISALPSRFVGGADATSALDSELEEAVRQNLVRREVARLVKQAA